MTEVEFKRLYRGAEFGVNVFRLTIRTRKPAAPPHDQHPAAADAEDIAEPRPLGSELIFKELKSH